MEKSTCSNCKHFKSWDHPGTREDLPESGWGCSLRLDETETAEAIFDIPRISEEEVMILLADQCPRYEFFDNSEDLQYLSDIFN